MNGYLFQIIGEDSILGPPPLGQEEDIQTLWKYLIQVSINTLTQFSNWDVAYLWNNLNLNDFPDICKSIGEIMKRKFVGCALLCQLASKKLGWKSSYYSVKEGYNTLLFQS